MKHLRNDNGYALFLTVLVIVIFSILAVSLMSMVQSGNKRATVREHRTQAAELSEKGLQHIINEINKELKLALGTEGLSHSEFIKELESILDEYKCDLNKNIKVSDLETGSYDICISSYTNVIDESGEENELRKQVTFESIGESKKQKKNSVYVMEIGADTVPDALKYALSTIEPFGPKKTSDGNIYLHGGLEVYGDIKAGNHLFTHSHGPGLSGNLANWRETTLPSLFSSTGKGNANIVLGGSLYQFSDKFNNKTLIKNGNNYTRRTTENFYQNHLNWTNNQSEYKQSNLSNMFANQTNLPKIVKRDWSGNEVVIEDKINEANINIKANETEKGFDYILSSTTKYSNIDTNKSLLFVGRNYKRFEDNNYFQSGKIESGTRTTFVRGNYKFDKMYIKGNVVIGNGTTSDYSSYYDNITIEGYTKDRGAQLFVDGNVTIQGANLKSNLTIYTTGSVTIRHTTIEGKEFSNNREGSLIVFSKERVQLANNSLYKSQASELKGFFYSEQALEMFGVGSNIKIHGGIAARRITLNAIRGNYRNETQSWSAAINPTSLNSQSRLVIQYDTELIENFLKLNPPEPIIREIDPSELIDRR